MDNKAWKDTGIRTKLLYASASFAFVAGWALTFWGFNLPPQGVVDNTVIVVLGQAMTYAAAAFGLGEYIQYNIAKLQVRNGQKSGGEAPGSEDNI